MNENLYRETREHAARSETELSRIIELLNAKLDACDATIDSLRRSLDHLGPAVLVSERHVKERDATIARLVEAYRHYRHVRETSRMLNDDWIALDKLLALLAALAEQPS
jgi:hypothetical protein